MTEVRPHVEDSASSSNRRALPPPHDSPLPDRTLGPGLLPTSLRGAGGWPGEYRRRLMFGDALCGFAAVGFASWMRWHSELPPRMYVVDVVVAVAWCLCVALFQGYNARLLGTGSEEFRAVVSAGALLLGLVGFSSFAFMLYFSRVYVLTLVVTVVLLGLVSRLLLRRSLSRSRSQGLLQRRTVVVGSASSASELVRELRYGRASAFDIVGVCVPAAAVPSGELEGIPVIGDPRDALFAVDLVDADVVAVSGNAALTGRQLRELGWALEERQVELVVSPGVFQVAGPRLSLRPDAGAYLLHVERPMHSGLRHIVKGVYDRTGALVLMLFGLPLMAFVALAIKLTSRGPVFFRQERVGTRGEHFKIFKFRTMVDNAEELKAALTAGHDTNEVLFKLENDPRITRVGSILRRLSIDEIPQLINVLRGEMSLVGPRPGLPSEVARYTPDALRRLIVQPGMTGLWQVSGRSSLDWESTVRLDLWYVDNWNLLLDLQILVRTLKAVFAGHGAH